MTPLTLAFWSFVTWRIVALLVYDAITAPLRDALGIKYDEQSQQVAPNPFAYLFICHKCMSIWIALLVVVAFLWPVEKTMIIPYILALSTGSIIINKIVNGE